jgi:hypothetical protein
LNPDELRRQGELSQSPKLRRAIACIAALARSEALEYEKL